MVGPEGLGFNFSVASEQQNVAIHAADNVRNVRTIVPTLEIGDAGSVFRGRIVGLVFAVSVGCRPANAPNANFHDLSVEGGFAPSELQRLSIGVSRPEVKFVISHFDDPARRSLRLLDGHFYWMHLLNGIAVPGSDERPIAGVALRTVADAYAWAKTHRLPLDLAWSDEGRLFSGDFYQSCLGVGRRFGIGSLLLVKRRHGGETPIWVFQLEYVDNPSLEELHVFYQVLARVLPSAITAQLRWLTRSAEQEALARQLQATEAPLSQRVLHLRDVVGSERVEVYSEGITAGQVRMFKTRPPAPGTTNSDEIVVLEAAPDELPAAAGLITATPQTPLAHVTLLAQNRGIPNVYVDQAFSDPAIATAMNDGSKAILRATSPNQLTLVPITEAQFTKWNELRRPKPTAGQHLRAANVQYSVDLASLAYSDVDVLRPLVGGKAAGYLLMLTQRRLPVVGPARVITTRAFDEHLAALRPVIDSVLRDQAFETDAKIRFLLLEGLEHFEQSHPNDTKTVPRFLAEKGHASTMVQLARTGGLTAAIRRAPITVSTMHRLRQELAKQFGSTARALRFRSSSTVEDIEGFNAAGLYESATGYFEPADLTDPKDRRHDFEYAMKKVWASYWGFVAFEERRRERIDHFSGAMAVLVHPRFDDEAELANGVITFTLLPAARQRMQVAVQVGATSVTNPKGGSLPEVVVVEGSATAATAPEVSREQVSSLAQGNVLTDAQLNELYAAGEALTRSALRQANHGLDELRQRSVFTLDIEFRLMAGGWLGAGSTGQLPFIVLKQARSLEPEPRGMDPSLFAEPIARDLLTRARRIHLHRCQSKAVSVEWLSLWTDVKSMPDMGYRERPYTAWVKLQMPGSDEVRWLQRDFASLEAEAVGGRAVTLKAALCAELVVQSHVRGIQVGPNRVVVERDDGRTLTEPVECSRRILHDTADAFLLDLIGQ